MARKPDDWMPLHIGPYMADTTHLTRDQHGAYLLLLMAYWRRGGPLPADDGQLAAMAKASPVEWRRLKPVIAPLFVEADGFWHQKRADEELTRARHLTAVKSAAGKKGADAKWQTDGKGDGKRMAQPQQNERQTDAPIPLPKPVSNNFIIGVGAVKPVMPTENRIALFQKWLAEKIGPHGWQIVGVAADPANPNHESAVTHCQKVARENGKGWPHAWPGRGVTA